MNELPTKPAAYWNPSESLSRVYYLRKTGEWYDSLAMKVIPPDQVTLKGLRFLADYKE